MKIHMKGAPDLDIESDVTASELIVFLQAEDRGIAVRTAVRVNFQGSVRFLDVALIDRERTLPGVVFAGYTVPPPPMSGIRLADSEPHQMDGAMR